MFHFHIKQQTNISVSYDSRKVSSILVNSGYIFFRTYFVDVCDAFQCERICIIFIPNSRRRKKNRIDAAVKANVKL